MTRPISKAAFLAASIAIAIMTACAVFPDSVSAQAQTRIQSRVVPSGEKRQLAFLTSLHPDCTADAEMTVRVVKQASHGAVEIDRGLGYTAFGRQDQRYDCNRMPEEGFRVNYKSDDGYAGEDQFEIEFFSPDGRYSLWRYAVTVK